MDRGRPPLLLMLCPDRYGMQACVRHGIDAVVVCGAAFYDEGLIDVPEPLRLVRVDDHASAEAVVLGLARAGLDRARFDGVQTTDEWALVTASLLAKHLGCQFPDPSTAAVFRDKSLQKRRVAAAGVRTARATVIEDVHDVSAFSALPYTKAVLKPAAGAATARTSVVRSLAELRSLSRAYRAASTTQRTFVLEEFVEGGEWLADGVVFNNELRFCALAGYAEPCLTVVDEQRPVVISRFDPDQDRWAYDKALPVVRRALAALGLRNGVFHMELFHDPGQSEPVFGECAARRGGALIHEELQAKFKVNLGESAVWCALGREPDLDVRVDPRVFGASYFLGRPGTLVGCPSPAEIMALPGVAFARVERPYGTRFGAGVQSTNQRVGQYLVAADSRVDMMERLDFVRGWFDERMVTILDGVSARELRARQRLTWPEADFGDTAWNEGVAGRAAERAVGG